MPGLGYAYTTNKRMIDKMLKQRIFVDTHADEFVNCIHSIKYLLKI